MTRSREVTTRSRGTRGVDMKPKFGHMPKFRNLFVNKLWRAVEDNACEHIVWSKDGRSVMFFDTHTIDFTKDVTPYFGDRMNWTSMQRQLNNYGFKSTAKYFARSEGMYELAHAAFCRDDPVSSNNIRRCGYKPQPFKLSKLLTSEEVRGKLDMVNQNITTLEKLHVAMSIVIQDQKELYKQLSEGNDGRE